MLKNSENNGTEEVDLVTPTPGTIKTTLSNLTQELDFMTKTAKSFTVKPICNDHLYNKGYYVWFIQ